MQLPQGVQAVVEVRKLREYVLNLDHPVGGHHAILFRDLLGITQGNWTVLRNALLQAAQNDEAVPGKASPYGQKWEQRLSLSGPGGTKIVLAVWLLEPSDPRPRLITCYVE